MSNWLDEVGADETAMNQIKKAIATFKQKQRQMLDAETTYLAFKNEYDEYCKSLALLLRQQGVEAMKCEDGSMLSVDTQIKASISKDLEKRKQVALWLEQHEMGNLVTHEYHVTATPVARALLESNNIAYDDEVNMNTNSVKAYVKGELERGNMSETDLPKGLSWYSFDIIKVN